MYVKVTCGVSPHSKRPTGDFLCEVHTPIYFDVVAAPVGGNAEWDENGYLIHPGDVDFGKAMGVDGLSYLHVLEIAAEQTEYEKARGLVPFRYVWWHDPDKGIMGVVTTRHIFILGDNGKTIDRV